MILELTVENLFFLKKIINNPPKNIDLLFLEGTMLRRSNEDFPTEKDVEEIIYKTIKNQENISFLISSSQNIDRIVSAYRACKRSGKILIIDIYTAWVLEQLKQYLKILHEWSGILSGFMLLIVMIKG